MYMHIHTHMHVLTHTYKLKRLIVIPSTTTNKIPKIYTEKEIKRSKIQTKKKRVIEDLRNNKRYDI